MAAIMVVVQWWNVTI